MTFLSQLSTAAETTTNNDIFTTLGIDWRLLILQIIAFIVLVALLGKFVYPWLMKSVDSRQAAIEAVTKATAEAKKATEANKEALAELLAEARKEATDIIGTAKLEAIEMVTASEAKAQKAAELIVAEAHNQLDKDVAQARKVLYNDTLELVGLATEKIIAKKLDKKADSELIASIIKVAQ